VILELIVPDRPPFDLTGFAQLRVVIMRQLLFEGCERRRADDLDFLQEHRLFNYGIGIHLIEGQPSPRSSQISPKADHLSFQSDSLDVVEERLNSRGIPFVKEAVVEHGLRITQIFLHDPDHNMVEICNCDCLPIRPLAPCAVLSSAQDIACPATPPAAEGGFASQRLVLANTAA